MVVVAGAATTAVLLPVTATGMTECGVRQVMMMVMPGNEEAEGQRRPPGLGLAAAVEAAGPAVVDHQVPPGLVRALHDVRPRQLRHQLLLIKPLMPSSSSAAAAVAVQHDHHRRRHRPGPPVGAVMTSQLAVVAARPSRQLQQLRHPRRLQTLPLVSPGESEAGLDRHGLLGRRGRQAAGPGRCLVAALTEVQRDQQQQRR